MMSDLSELTLIVNALRISYVVYMVLLFTWFTYDKLNWFNYEKSASGDNVVSFNGHPLCMSLAWIVLMSEGVVAWRYYEQNLGVSHGLAKSIHTSLQYSAVVIMSIGLAVIFKNHGDKNINHMYSAHSWMGLFVVGAMVFQILLATYAFLFTKYERFKMRVLVWHRFGGLVIYLGGVATICMGFQEKQGFISCDDSYCHEKIIAAVLTMNALVVAMLTTAIFIFEGESINLTEVGEKVTLLTNHGSLPVPAENSGP